MVEGLVEPEKALSTEDPKVSDNKTNAPVAAEKDQLLTAFLQSGREDILQPKDMQAHMSLASAELIPMLTFLQAPGEEQIDKNLLSKLQAKLPPETMFRASLVPGTSIYEYNVINPVGLCGEHGKGYGDMNANPPAEYRALLSCKRESIAREPKVRRDTLWYGGAIKDANGKLFDFAAADYHDTTNYGLHYRLIQYDHHDGKGPDLRFQGLPEGVGKNVQSIDIMRSRDGKYFDIEITSYPQWMNNPVNSKPGWVPIRTKVSVGIDGQIIDQNVGGRAAKYTQSLQTEDWRYDYKAWSAPFAGKAPWSGPPK